MTVLADDDTFAEGMVSITFDDGYHSAYDQAMPILANYHFYATFYITSGMLGRANYLDEAKVFALKEAGHDIGSHCVRHVDLRKLPFNLMEDELSKSKWALEQFTKSPVIHFAPPYGRFNKKILSSVEKYYLSCRSTIQGLNTKNGFNPFAIKSFYVLKSTTFHDLESWLDEALDKKKWLVLVYHGIDEKNDGINVTPEVLSMHLKFIEQRGIIPITLSEALKKIKNER